MASLDEALFRGERILDSDLMDGEATNRGEAVSEILAKAGRSDNETVACILLTLSPDNQKVTRGELVVRGLEKKEYEWEAHKIWPPADKRITTTISLPALDSFTFSDGGLTSDYMEDEEIVHFHHLRREGRPAEPVLEVDRRDRGIGKFCIRLICNISKDSSAEHGVKLKYTVVLYPGEKGVITAMTPAAARPEWPGIKLGDGEIRMLPKPTSPWGCPITPVIIAGQPFSDLPRAPSSPNLRAAIGAIMRRCGQPELSRTGAKVLEKWDKLVKNPGSLHQKKPSVVWPAEQPARPASQPQYSGRNSNTYRITTKAWTESHGGGLSNITGKHKQVSRRWTTITITRAKQVTSQRGRNSLTEVD